MRDIQIVKINNTSSFNVVEVKDGKVIILAAFEMYEKFSKTPDIEEEVIRFYL